jgi:hypothetical protein
MKKMKIWSFFHYSILLGKWFLEIVPDANNEKEAEERALKNIKVKNNYSFAAMGTMRSVISNVIEIDVNQFVISGIEEKVVETPVQESVVQDNLNKFLFDLELIKDKFTQNDTEKELVEQIKSRVIKENTQEVKTVDKSTIINK